MVTKYKIIEGNKEHLFNTMLEAEAYSGGRFDITEVQVDEPIPVKEVPQEVKTWRIQAVLSLMNLEQQALSLIDSLPEPSKTVAIKAWYGGSTTQRNSPTVAYLQQELNLTTEQVDNIFIQANQIEA